MCKFRKLIAGFALPALIISGLSACGTASDVSQNGDKVTVDSNATDPSSINADILSQSEENSKADSDTAREADFAENVDLNTGTEGDEAAGMDAGNDKTEVADLDEEVADAIAEPESDEASETDAGNKAEDSDDEIPDDEIPDDEITDDEIPDDEVSNEDDPEAEDIIPEEGIIPDDETEDDNWYVVNYSDYSGNQGMFYTISNEAADALIVIDGGWSENTEHVRNVIADLGNHVDAWIITHYHNDHVDAFNNIYADPQGITIDAVYDSPMDYDQYVSVAYEWDKPESFERYLEVTAGRDNVHHIQRNEVLDISGLKFEFFNAYDSTVAYIGDIPNNAALVFKVTGNEESMLFASDCHSDEIADILIGTYGESLKADYYQAAHHGNSTNWQKMMEAVSPGTVFLDGPGWLMEGESYRAKDLIAYCINNGISYKTYTSAPNSIILK